MSKYKYVFGYVTEANLVYELLAIKSYHDNLLKFVEYKYDINNYNKTVEQLCELNECIRSDMRAKLATANTHFINVIDKIKDYLFEYVDYKLYKSDYKIDDIKNNISNQWSLIAIDRDISFINLMGAIRKQREFIDSEV